MILGEEVAVRDLQERDFDDSYKVFNRLRNGHACIMSIVFIVLYPLGAIAIHLPTDRVFPNLYLRNRALAWHVPIQIIGFVMMVGGMGLGIRMAYDLDFLNHPVHAHVVIGLLVTCTLILFQPAMGVFQHRYFRKTGKKSVFAYIHRWIGRVAIMMGMINSGLGFQLARDHGGVIISAHSYIRSYVLLGVLVAIWFSLVVWDDFAARRSKRVTDGGEKGRSEEAKRPVSG